MPINTFPLRAFLLLLLAPNAGLVAQEPAAPSDKTITIQKKIVRPDGTSEEETIQKKGKAAEAFDIEAYLKENDQPGVRISIVEESADGEYRRSIQRDGRRAGQVSREVEDALEVAGRAVDATIREVRIRTGDGRGFLGVEEDSDEDPGEKGLTVEVIRCSAAAMAGIRSNDLIRRIDDQPINSWSDLTSVLRGKKAGDSVAVEYERDGKSVSTVILLTTREEVYSGACAQTRRGYLGVSPTGKEGRSGVEIEVIEDGAAEKAGLQDGDRIVLLDDAEIKDWEDLEDFMSATQAGRQVKVSFSRDGKRLAKEITLTDKAPALQLEIVENRLLDLDRELVAIEIDKRQKSACLGVFTAGKEAGARVSGFTDSSAAREAQMEIGDVITAVNDRTIANQDDLWNAIAEYQPGDLVTVQLKRGEQTRSLKIALQACQSQNKVSITAQDEAGDREIRRFYTWKWGAEEAQRLRQNQVIVIHRDEAGALPVQDAPQAPAGDRKLELRAFKISPDAAAGLFTLQFSAKPEPVIVSLLDQSGRQIFREELNAFNGSYQQAFDLRDYAKGT
ncbi:MAG: PDZ domain-containing protein, partial [Saprospiraceae bacterium]